MKKSRPLWALTINAMVLLILGVSVMYLFDPSLTVEEEFSCLLGVAGSIHWLRRPPI